MKKIITLVWLLILAGTLSGQQVVDYILKAKAYTETGRADQAINLLNGAIIQGL